MKLCSRCHAAQSWELADGRFKCRGCGARYTWTSVWNSVRLPEATKQRLVETFVQGVSVYQQRKEEGACVRSRERFYRLMRAVCALDAQVPPSLVRIHSSHARHAESRACMRGWATAPAVAIIDLVEENGRMSVRPTPSAVVDDVLPVLRERSAVGGICLHQNRAYANLQVQRDWVVIPRNSRALLTTSLSEAFWEYTSERLRAFRYINHRFLHLHLGEMCFRFNHRDRDLNELMRQRLMSVSNRQARSIVHGRPHDARCRDASTSIPLVALPN
jgi:transposase